MNAPAAEEYSSGFRKPRGFFPALSRWSLSSATTLANVGLDALVPDTASNVPAMFTAKFTPCVDTSGYARPEVLNRPAFVFPSALRYVCTAVVW